MRILFMGTPNFAVASLDALVKDGQDVIAVVTSPDKPAGRGRELQASAVKKYALEKNLTILQPEKLKSPDFLAELRELDPELIVVVAFRMLPEEVWAYPPMGTINLHASLLPQYRGAAPINRVIMNGETETGITTFFIEKEIDTGKIIMQEPVEITPQDTAGTLHDRIMVKGARLLRLTVRAIREGNVEGRSQSELLKPGEEIKTAPKIFKEDCRIQWNWKVQQVYDHVRGLSPYPAAWTTLVSTEGREYNLKVYSTGKLERETIFPPGTLMTDGKSRFQIVCNNGIILLTEVQMEGKKRMKIEDFMRGLKDLSSWTVK
jgi:methionyl-tRNA formyltransferase